MVIIGLAKGKLVVHTSSFFRHQSYYKTSHVDDADCGRGSWIPMELSEKKSPSSASIVLPISHSLSKPLSEDDKYDSGAGLAGLEFEHNFIRLWLADDAEDELEASVIKPELSEPDSRLKEVFTVSRIVSRLLERFKPVPSFCSSILMNSSCSLW